MSKVQLDLSKPEAKEYWDFLQRSRGNSRPARPYEVMRPQRPQERRASQSSSKTAGKGETEPAG